MVSGLSLEGGGGEPLSPVEVGGGGDLLPTTVVKMFTHEIRVVTYTMILHHMR